MEIRYTQGRNAEDGQPREMSAPGFDAFEQQIRDSVTRIGVLPTDDKDALNKKKRRLPYIWHAFKAGATRRRRADSAGDLYFLMMDLDGITAEGWACIKGVLAAYRGFAYTTASHLHPTANGEHRLRIVLAPARPITAAEKPLVLQQLQTAIMDIVDIVYDGPANWDSRVYNPAQMLFLPDENAVFETFSGQPVDVDALLAAAPMEALPCAAPAKGETDDFERLIELDAIDDNTFADLRSALWHPAILQLAESYPSWVDMGNRLAWFKDTEYEEQARALWLDWSAAADNGDVDAAAAKWEQLTADRTGYQAIFSMAQKNDWKNPGADRLRTAVAGADDFEALPPEEEEPPRSLPHTGGYGRPGRFIVEGLLPEGVSMIYGASSSFKSYFVLSLLCRIAMKNYRWAGRNLKGGAVLYVAAEGGSSVMPRVGAWADKYNHGQPLPLFYTLPLAVDLSVPGNVKVMVNEIKRIMLATGEPLRVVAVDTLSQSMGQGEENSASDMAKFIAGAAKVYQETGAAVVLVHHSGKDRSKGMRGSSAAFANADAVIRVERIDDAVNLVNEKQRSGPAQPTRGYNVPTVPLPAEVIAANEETDEEYTSTEGDIYDRVRLETERVFEDVPLAEITPMFDDEEPKAGRGGSNESWVLEQMEEAGGSITRTELRERWKTSGKRADSLRLALYRMKEKGVLHETDEGVITDMFLTEEGVESEIA